MRLRVQIKRGRCLKRISPFPSDTRIVYGGGQVQLQNCFGCGASLRSTHNNCAYCGRETIAKSSRPTPVPSNGRKMSS